MCTTIEACFLEHHGPEGCPIQRFTTTGWLPRARLPTRARWTFARLLTCDTCLAPHALHPQARSVILATIADVHYLFVGLGDGHVVSFPLEVTAESTLALGTPKKVALGTQPVGLACFRNNGMVCVFVASDRPAVIYCSGGKLLYANVNMGEVRISRRFSCPFLCHENTLFRFRVR